MLVVAFCFGTGTIRIIERQKCFYSIYRSWDAIKRLEIKWCIQGMSSGQILNLNVYRDVRIYRCIFILLHIYSSVFVICQNRYKFNLFGLQNLTSGITLTVYRIWTTEYTIVYSIVLQYDILFTLCRLSKRMPLLDVN